MPVICEGCGQRVTIPPGYRRSKIQCACGVICTVPESERTEFDAAAAKQAAAAAKVSAVEEQAERWLRDEDASSPTASEPPRFRDPEPEPAPPLKPAVAERLFPCRRCRRLVRRQGECPDCDGAARSQAETGNAEPVWWPSVDEPEGEDDEDSSPYRVEGADDVKCPSCSFMLPPGSVLCVRCGFHFKKRKKVAKTYQPIERVWETNASLRSRAAFFVFCSVAFFISGFLGVLNGGVELGVFIFFYLFVTAMAAFGFGTFDRIHLIRDARGRVQLTKTWRVCFFARQPQRIDVRSYESIVSGRHRDVTVWEYWLVLILLIPGIIPGIVWWYLVVYKISFHVSLSRDHGFPAYVLYSGWSEMQMKEIAYTVRDASGLRYEEG